MEKNKQYLQEDIFLKKYLQEVELDKTKDSFTVSIMDTILAEEKKVVFKPAPLISKKIWLLSIGFIATCLGFLLNGKSSITYNFPEVNTDYYSKIEIPNLFGSLSISNTMLYAIIIFPLMVFVQIFYLKNHFDKRFN